MNLTEQLLAAIADPKKQRADVAALYARAIQGKLHRQGESDWGQVNDAIINRWSKAALVWVKREAWKQVEAAA